MFDHPNFRDYTFSEVPANRDLFLIDVKDMAEFEWEWLELYAGREYRRKSLVIYAAVRARFDEVLELSWYPNINTRFHEVRVTLPKSAFVRCIGQSARWQPVNLRGLRMAEGALPACELDLRVDRRHRR